MTEINIRKYRGTDLCSTIASSLAKASIQPLRFLFTSDTLSVRSYVSCTNYKEILEDCELFPVFLSFEESFFFLNGKRDSRIYSPRWKGENTLLSIQPAKYCERFCTIYICIYIYISVIWPICTCLWKVERRARNRELKEWYGGDFLEIEECYR